MSASRSCQHRRAPWLVSPGRRPAVPNLPPFEKIDRPSSDRRRRGEAPLNSLARLGRVRLGNRRRRTIRAASYRSNPGGNRMRKPRVAEFYPSVIAISALAFVCTLAAATDLASGQNAGIIDPGQSLNWQPRALFSTMAQRPRLRTW